MKRKFYVTSNGYILVYAPEHSRAYKGGAYGGYVLEHILVAERQIGRSLRDDEVVHHMDMMRSNNAPDNLLVLTQDAHVKLHMWMNSIGYSQKNRQYQYGDNMEEVLSICRRCYMCKSPTKNKQFCSAACRYACTKTRTRSGIDIPSKDELESLLSSKSWRKVGAMYGVSDNAVRKWAKKLGINPNEYAYGFKRDATLEDQEDAAIIAMRADEPTTKQNLSDL